jgi:putative phosphoribosyl transferase
MEYEHDESGSLARSRERVTTATVLVDAGSAELAGDLATPGSAAGTVLFAHGSGSSRHSPRNRAVAAGLNRAGLGTLLLDLLTDEEERADVRTAALRFDIGLLSSRLAATIDWLDASQPAGRPLGLFGASTGAAAALAAAAERPGRVGAVVSRGGRPDLAGPALGQAAGLPVLLIVGGRDPEVTGLNQEAARQLGGTSEVRTIPGASHLFEEPGALDQVTELAASWFRQHLGPADLAG